MNAMLERLRTKLKGDAWLDEMMKIEAAFAESFEPCTDDLMEGITDSGDDDPV